LTIEISKSFLLSAAVAALPLLAQGCATAPPRGKAVPAELQAAANVIGYPAGIRYFPRDAAHVAEFESDYLDALTRERAYLHISPGTKLPPVAYLAISGGGDNGAFGAGLLNGWTKAGTRPTFKIVTGVSTGALIAPFAFLGSDYDEKLKALYTSVSLHDIAKERSLLSIVYGDAMADTTPLHNLVKKYLTQEVVDAIAAEHEKGRILLIATTNLDVRRSVIWNVTEVAATNGPNKLDLIQRILIASAAIPGTFPPVMIDVEAGGKAFQEMHVDGGTTGQVFVYPAATQLYKLFPRQRSLYIIRNARLDPQWAQVDRRTLPIAFRAITTLIQYQGIADLYTLYSVCQRDNVDYNLAYIPPTFNAPRQEDFDPQYMTALFAVGQGLAAMGHYWWYKQPPVLLSGVSQERPTF